MNLIERDMLTRCLGSIYEQMLMGDTDAALASIEGVTWLVRYMAAGKSSQRATLENELRAVRAVFQICRGEVGLETGVSGLDPYLEVKRTAVLYEPASMAWNCYTAVWLFGGWCCSGSGRISNTIF